MDELDEYISSIVNKKINEHSNYEYIIKNTLKNNKNYSNSYSIFKKIAIFIVSISVIGGLAFASQLFKKDNKNQNEYVFNQDKYVQNLEMDYKTIDNLSVKIDSILVDDYYIQLNIDYLYPENITTAESKLLIKDENDNIIYETIETEDYYENIFKKPTRDNNIRTMLEKQNEDTLEEKTQYIATRMESSYKNVSGNNLKRTLKLYSDIDSSKFPESKKLYIQLEDIALKKDSKVVKKVKGVWNFEIEIDDKNLNRKTNSFTQKDINQSESLFTIIKAEESNLQLKLKIQYNGKENIKNLIDITDLSNIQIVDKTNNKYINAASIYIEEDTYIKVDYNVNREELSDNLILKINKFNEIEIEKNQS